MAIENEILLRRKHPKYAGFLYLYQFGILIDPPIINMGYNKFIDIHGLGCEEDGVAPFHLVIDYEGGVHFSDYTAGNFCKLKSKESSIVTNRYTREICKERVIHYISGEMDKQFVVDVITMDEIENVTVQQKGSCSIPVDNLGSIISFTKEDRIYASDVTIIIGNFKGKSIQSLLLCRFWNCVTGPSRTVVDELLLEAIKMTKNNNVEATRSGGSNGIFKGPNKAFM